MWTSDDLTLSLLRVVCLACGTFLCAMAGLAVASVPSAEAPSFGMRGVRRAAARAHVGFRLLEPVLSKLAGMVRCVSLPKLRAACERSLAGAGDPLGLSADELLVLHLLSGFATWLVGTLLLDPQTLGGLHLPLFLMAGLVAPALRLRALADERARDLERSLPAAMDLCVLCMGAGADFPAALALSVSELGTPHKICREELGAVLEHVRLGRTRIEALQYLAQRTHSRGVHQFVSAVCQSEEKGTPLLEALTIQAATLRQRRSVLAEEMAARASVRLIFPLMLMVGSVLIVILAPFIIDGVGL